ncbi:hypothetical protein ACFSKU_00810 [Pontibacter silvestris]|uniref:Outer membrane protein beta-barrel domain-containing protein n=1 Tax=Pontibacter silvestris TaxID=2305183 RepID=A0ABW4WRX9_9BACT|nr:hypothetical protein [Pontibacter silvestris]MCC9136149.1 hypothetical protein [Pontibacter silvestris]
MKKLFRIGALALALIGSSFAVKAQTVDSRGTGVRLSVGPEVGVAVGKLADAYDFNLGGSVQADIPVINNDLYVTINTGYNNVFASGDGSDLNLIPAKAGLKFFPVGNFYVQGEAGATFLTNNSDLDADNAAAFVYAPQVGYLFHLGDKSFIDAGVRFESNSKFYDGGKASNFFGLRLAYAFGL